MDFKLRFWRNLFSSYALAFCYYFKILLIFLAYLLISLIIECMLFLPLYVLACALFTAISGAVKYGDPLNQPDYMIYIIGTTIALILFFSYYMTLALSFP
ncbi:MAG: hypothetical protein ACI4TW_02245, partial [Prevotella sp.]